MAQGAGEYQYGGKKPRYTDTTDYSLGSSQDCTTSALRAFSVVEVTHLDVSWRCHLDAGAASRIYTIPNGLTGLCADEVLFKFTCGPGTYRQSFALGRVGEPVLLT
jgi:hypothetical protein